MKQAWNGSNRDNNFIKKQGHGKVEMGQKA